MKQKIAQSGYCGLSKKSKRVTALLKYRTGFNNFNIMKVVCIVKNADNSTKIDLLRAKNDYESVVKKK